MRKLIYLLLLVSLPAGASSLDSLRHFFREVQTFNARFDQVVLDEALNPVQETSGQMWIERPGRFRWDYDRPSKQQIVSDGAKVYIYDVDLEQVTVRKMSGALGETPAILLAGKGDLEASFNITPLGAQGSQEWVQMKPKKKEGNFDDIRIGFEQGRIRTLELVDGLGQTTRITLRDTKENPKIEKKKFVFVAPKGVDVIQQID